MATIDWLRARLRLGKHSSLGMRRVDVTSYMYQRCYTTYTQAHYMLYYLYNHIIYFILLNSAIDPYMSILIGPVCDKTTTVFSDCNP